MNFKSLLRRLYCLILFRVLPGIQKYFVRRYEIAPRVDLVRTLPINFREEDRRYFARELHRLLPPVYLATVHSARVRVEDGVAVKCGCPVEESLFDSGVRTRYGLRSILSVYRARAKYLATDSEYLLAYGLWGTGFGHWLGDTLPRFFLLREHISEYVILLPESAQTGTHLESLAALGVRREQIAFFPETEVLSIPTLKIVSFVGSGCNVRDEVIREMRQHYLDHYHLSAVPRRRIYVSRSRMSRRHIVNEAELLGTLARYNFEIIHPEDHSFQEQLKIMSEVEIFLGLTGSAFSNIIFLPNAAHVVEFKMKEDLTNLHYFSLASALGLRYSYALCETRGSLDRIDADFVVPVEEVDRIIGGITRTAVVRSGPLSAESGS